jgi:hypothetical protein
MPIQIEQLDLVPQPQQGAADRHQQQQPSQQQGAGTQPPHQLDNDVERAVTLLRSRELRLRAT